jgi:hypothetical protein
MHMQHVMMGVVLGLGVVGRGQFSLASFSIRYQEPFLLNSQKADV